MHYIFFVCKLLRFQYPVNHFMSWNFMCCFKYSKRSWLFMSVPVFPRTVSNSFLRVLFRETTPGDGAGAAASALHTLWEVIPSAGGTVRQKQTGGFEGTICSSIIDEPKRPQTKLTDFAISWKYSASFCRPVWKEMFQKKRLVQAHTVWFEKVQMVKKWIYVYFKRHNTGAGRLPACAERWTHPEEDERQISPDLCVLLDQMTGLNQSLLSCNQLLQLHTHTYTHI